MQVFDVGLRLPTQEDGTPLQGLRVLGRDAKAALIVLPPIVAKRPVVK